MSMSTTTVSRRGSKGFTLLEILVAVLVLTIGLLGFAGILLSGINSNQESYQVSQAQAILEDLASRMRANRGYINWDTRANRTVAGGALSNTELSANTYSPAGTYLCNGDQPAALAANDIRSPIRAADIDVWQICDRARDNVPEPNGTPKEGLPDGEVRVVCNDVPVSSPKPNPYVSQDHPVFSSDPGEVNSEFDAEAELAEDQGVCSPGSSFTLAIGWTPLRARAGAGADADVKDNKQFINPRCVALGFAATKTCITMDIIP